MDLGDRADRLWFLIRDRNSTFTTAFDAVFTGADIRIIRTPIQAPRANAIAERFIGTLHRECLDHLPEPPATSPDERRVISRPWGLPVHLAEIHDPPIPALSDTTPQQRLTAATLAICRAWCSPEE